MNTDKIKAIQTILEVEADGDWGKISQAALDKVTTKVLLNSTKGLASSFADPADIKAFKLCKAKGGSDLKCFSVGDNGQGLWGDDTTANVPMCALPREDWRHLGAKARGAKVRVRVGTKDVICELRDTMPSKSRIKNGVVIDLNPAASAALGLNPPFLAQCSWAWADAENNP